MTNETQGTDIAEWGRPSRKMGDTMREAVGVPTREKYERMLRWFRIRGVDVSYRERPAALTAELQAAMLLEDYISTWKATGRPDVKRYIAMCPETEKENLRQAIRGATYFISNANINTVLLGCDRDIRRLRTAIEGRHNND